LCPPDHTRTLSLTGRNRPDGQELPITDKRVDVVEGDDELVSSLLFDAEATRDVVSDWRKGNIDAMLNRSSKKYVTRTTSRHFVSAFIHRK